MKNINVAIVGYPGSGKTTLLSVMCWKRNYKGLTKEAVNFTFKNRKLIENGEFPQATDPTERACELVWQIPGYGRKIILRSRDFAGESWRNFIDSYGKNKKADSNDSEIGEFLKDAVAIVVCVDIEKLVNNEDIEQVWILRAVQNYLEIKHLSERHIALVITKYDKVKYLAEAKGGMENFLLEYFDSVDISKFQKRIFPITAVETELSDDDHEIPQKGFKSYGLEELEDWFVGRIKKYSRLKRIIIQWGIVLSIGLGCCISYQWGIILAGMWLLYGGGYFIFRDIFRIGRVIK